MHIYLDSNAIGDNFRFDSIAFENLFDFIRRTQSVLVIPEAVRIEVLATFDRILDQRTKKARNTWDDLHRILVSPQEFDEPDSEYERDALMERLDSPDDNITTVNFTAEIDVLEIVRRGAQRKKPANSNGEELRDVVIWLTAIEYARTSKAPLAFISGDAKGFWDGTSPHPSIKADAEQAGVHIDLYPNVESFVRSNSLRHRDIAESEISKYVQSDVVEGQVAQWIRMATALWRNARLNDIATVRLAFDEGTLFDIDSDVQLSEFSYRFKVRLDVTTSITTAPFNAKLFNSSVPFDSQRSYAQLANVSSAFSTYLAQPTLPGFVYGSFVPEPSFGSTGVTIEGVASFSVRLVGGRVEKVILDDVTIETAEDSRLDAGAGRQH
jgi:hypothetical protein